MIKNNKGFVVTEVLILSTVIIGVLVFMYIQFKNIDREYQYSFKYDTVTGMYLANNIINYINVENYDLLVNTIENNNSPYLDISDCNEQLFTSNYYCEDLFEKSNIEQILFTEENLGKLKLKINDLDLDMQKYIKQIQTLNSENDYRIIIKYKDNTFASLRFNKGNAYVQSGLITYLDAINNTGEGHSDTTTNWKDLSENNNDAALYHNPTWTNNSIIFDGTTNYARIENTANMTYPNGLTWEARLKVLSLTGLNNGTLKLFGNWNTTGGGIYFNNTNKLSANLKLNGYLTTSTNTGTNVVGEFYTVSLTYDNEALKLYINGELVSTNARSSTYSSSTLPLTLGGEPNENPTILTNYSNVEFQNVLLYNRALSDLEIKRNYNADMARY